MAASGVTGPDICARETHLRMALSAVARAGAVVEEAFPELDQTYRTLRAMPWASDRGCSPDAVQRHFKATLAQNIRQGRELTIDAVVDAQLGKSAIFSRMVGFLSQFDVLACPAVGLMLGPVEGEYPRPAACPLARRARVRATEGKAIQEEAATCMTRIISPTGCAMPLSDAKTNPS